VLLTGNEKIKDFILYNNSSFSVFIEAYPGNTWILDNLKDVKKADIEPLNLKASNYGDEPNTGIYYMGYPQDDTKGGFFQFSFVKNDVVVKELPPLKFVYKNDSDPENNEIKAQVNLTVGEDKPLPLGLINDPTSNMIKIEEKGGEYDFYVNSDSVNFILLYGSISGDETLTTGYSWYLENTELIEYNEVIDLLQLDTFANRPASFYDIMTTTYRYVFQVNDFTAKNVLPTLVFTYKQSAESSSIEARAVVHLRSHDDTIITFNDSVESEKKLNVDRNEVLLIEMKGNPSTGYNWILDNVEEVKAAKGIDILNVDDEGVAPFIVTTENKPGDSGIFRFKFQIKEDAEAGEIQPSLKFIQARSKDDVISTAKLALRVKKERKKEDLNDTSLPVIFYDQSASTDNVIYVESNSILRFIEETNPSTGCSWILKNQDEINRSDFMDYIGSRYESYCPDYVDGIRFGFGFNGCGGDETFSFRIWDIQKGDKLPEIHMVYGHGWAIETEFYKTLDLVLKVKKSENEKGEEKDECSIKGYKCCTKANIKVHYQDEDGNWGVEHGEWCYIKEGEQKEEKEDKTAEPKLIRSCTGENLGYPCCERTHKDIYIDKDGQWAVEDDHWCGLPICTYTGNYPVCQKTTKVVFKDTEKWGVENDQWCVLCL